MNNNLTELQEQITHDFFNKLTLNINGKIKIGDLIQYCNDNSNLTVAFDPSTIKYPNWLYTLQMNKGFNLETTFTLQEFLDLGIEYPDLNTSESLFLELEPINLDEELKIKFNDIREHFKSEPEIIPRISQSVFWLNNLKTDENLTNETELDLNDLLNYQQKYYYAYWPVSNK